MRGRFRSISRSITTTIHLARWPDIHIGSLTLNLSPTKHVYFMLLAALLVFLMMWIAGRQLQKTRATGQHPRGFSGAVEAAVLWVRNEIAMPTSRMASGSPRSSWRSSSSCSSATCWA